MQLYFPTGLHHVVVLATDKGQRGLVRFFSLWFEIEPNDGAHLEFRAREAPTEEADDRAANGGESDRPMTSWHTGRDYHSVTCCKPHAGIDALQYHAVRLRMPDVDDLDGKEDGGIERVEDGDLSQSWVSEWLPEKCSDGRDDLLLARVYEPYDESKCAYVFADTILFSEPFVPTGWKGPLGHISHYLMEFLSNLFFVVESRRDFTLAENRSVLQKPIFIMRRHSIQWKWPYTNTGPYSKRRYADTRPPPFHAALRPMFSDREWIEWTDVLGMVDTLRAAGGPSSVCFRRLHALQDYNMTMPSSAEIAPYWRKYRERLWAQLRVLVQHGVPANAIRRVIFLRRQSSRRMLNHDENAAMLQARGFEVHSITPDFHPLSIVAFALTQAMLLIGINSGAYNAVFLRTGCGVLELAPYSSHLFGTEGSFQVGFAFQVGFVSLGVHQLVYACQDLFVSNGFSEVHSASNSTDAALRLMPIVVSPRTILALIHELVEVLELVRRSSFTAGSITVKRCLSWEANHTQSWAA